MTCPSAAKKGCSSHLLGVGPGEADKTALVQQLKPGQNFSHLFPGPAFFRGRLLAFGKCTNAWPKDKKITALLIFAGKLRNISLN